MSEGRHAIDYLGKFTCDVVAWNAALWTVGVYFDLSELTPGASVVLYHISRGLLHAI